MSTSISFMGRWSGAGLLAALWLGGCASQAQAIRQAVGERAPANAPADEAPQDEARQVVRFTAGSAWLSPQEAAVLDALAVRLRQEELYLQIEGYADESNLLADDRRLADTRAQAVYQRLSRHGIAPDRMTLVSRPQTGPSLMQAASDAPAPRRQVVIATVQ